MSRSGSLWGSIQRYFDGFRKSQRRTIHDLCWGLLGRGQVGLAEMARGMRDRTTVRHRIKRIERFVTNPRIGMAAACMALVRWMVSGEHEAVVALDWTDLGEYRLLAGKVAIARRGVPVAWRVLRQGEFSRRTKSRNDAEEQLILLLRDALKNRRWILVADRGFARADLFRKLDRWGIRYVIRSSGNPWIETAGYAGRVASLGRRPGQVVRYDDVLYHKTGRVPVSLVLTHREPAVEPWYLITNVPGTRRVEQVYRKRMWIEESFRDAKSGLGLKRLWLSESVRFERLLIVVAIVMLLNVLAGLHYRREHGDTDPQLTTKRRGRTLSVFRLGFELIRLHGLPPGLRQLRLLPLADQL